MKLLSAALVSSALIAGQAMACDLPTKPTLPDGSKAEMAEMVAGQQAVKAYQKDLGGYRDCVNADIDKADKAMKETKSEEEKAALKAEHAAAVANFNKAVEMEEKIAGEFNLAIRAFNAKKNK